MIIAPPEKGDDVQVVRGPNIKPLPLAEPPAESIRAPVVLKVGDNITTDDIMPAGAKLLPLRSNIPAMAEHVFERVDHEFAKRAREAGSSIVVGGSNYGQGSSREHAALAPMYLGLKAVLAKSFARIHATNLVNFGILPLLFENEGDYDRVEQGDELEIAGVREAIQQGADGPHPQCDARQRVHGPSQPVPSPGGDAAGGRCPELCKGSAGVESRRRVACGTTVGQGRRFWLAVDAALPCRTSARKTKTT